MIKYSDLKTGTILITPKGDCIYVILKINKQGFNCLAKVFDAPKHLRVFFVDRSDFDLFEYDTQIL